MKLTPTKFYAAFKDGLLEMEGHEFEAAGRVWVVHKLREPYCEWDRSCVVSDKETGYRVGGVEKATFRRVAARRAKDVLEKLPVEFIKAEVEKAAEVRKTLKILGG